METDAVLEYSSMGPAAEYRVYRRRWAGVVVIMLQNIAVCWMGLTYAPVADDAAAFFRFASASRINWLSIAFFFAYILAAPLAVRVCNRWGLRADLYAGAVLMTAGSCLRVAGTYARPHGVFGVLMLGQIVLGLAQPFMLNVPSHFSDMYFTSDSRVSANALMSLSNPVGGAIANLVSPIWCTAPQQVRQLTLYSAILAIGCAATTAAMPGRPPLPPCPSAAVEKQPLRVSVRQLARNRKMIAVFILFSTYVGFFNAFSTLLEQLMTPYGYSNDEAGYTGAILIGGGIVGAVVLSPINDRFHCYILYLRTLVPLVGLGYVAAIFMSTTSRQLVGPFVVSGVIGVTSFTLLPIVLEWIQEQVAAVSPELTAGILWSGGQLFGAIFTIIMNELRHASRKHPRQGSRDALIFEGVVAAAVVPIVLMCGNSRTASNQRVLMDAAVVSSAVPVDKPDLS